MMDHNNINDDAHNKDKNTQLQETLAQDTVTDTNAFADSTVASQPNTDTNDNNQSQDFFEAHDSLSQAAHISKQQPRSLLVIILIIAFTAVLGLLIFSYMYDLAGLRTFATEYQVKPKKRHDHTEKTQHSDKKQSDDSLNASKQVQQNNQKSEIDNDIDTDTDIDTVKKIKEKPVTDTQTLQNTDDKENTNVLTPLSENLKSNSLERTINNADDYTKTYRLALGNLHKDFKHISNQFLLLNQKLMQSEPYLDILIDIRSELQSKKITVPTLTEYAAAGFPTDMIIVTDAMKLLKKLSIIETRKSNSDTFLSFIKNFAIITPQSNSQGLTGVYRNIGKALDDGDFNQVERLIGESSEDTQKALRELYILVADKKAIYAEIKMLNDIIIDNVFEQTHNNTEN